MLKIENIIKRLKKTFSFKNLMSLSVIAVISILLISLLHFMGVFNFLELKMYDFKFNARESLYDTDRKLDVAIIYGDDETYELLSKKFSYPYPRGKVYAKAIKNIASLGAKVIVLDYVFDSPDLNTTRSKGVRDDLLEGKYTSLEEKQVLEQQFFIQDEDRLLANAILEVKDRYDTDVVLSGKIKIDPNSTQTYSVLEPSSTISNPNKGLLKSDFGLVDISHDSDGFLRRYIVYQKLKESKQYNYSLAIEAVLKYYDENSALLEPIYNHSERKLNIGNNKLHAKIKVCILFINIFDKLFLGIKPPEDILVKAKLNESKSLKLLKLYKKIRNTVNEK